MKKLLILLAFVPSILIGQSTKVSDLPADATVDTSDILYVIDKGVTSKKMLMPTLLDVVGQYSDSVRTELTDSIGQLRSEIGAGAVGWGLNGNALTVTDLGDSVGIGTSTPLAKLHVVGNSYIDGDVTTTGTMLSEGIFMADTTAYINFDYTGVNSQYLRFGLNNRIRSNGGYLEFTDNSGTKLLSEISNEYISLSGITVSPITTGLSGLILGGDIAYSTTINAKSFPYSLTGTSALMYFRGHPTDNKIINYCWTTIDNSGVRISPTTTKITTGNSSGGSPDSTSIAVNWDNISMDINGAEIEFTDTELTIPTDYTISSNNVNFSDNVTVGDTITFANDFFIGSPNSSGLSFGKPGETSMIYAIQGGLSGITGMNYLHLFGITGSEDMLRGFRNDTTRHAQDTAIAPSWAGVREYVAANGGGSVNDEYITIDTDDNNVFIGDGPGKNVDGTAIGNTAVGDNSGTDLVGGDYNSFYGHNSGKNTTSGMNNFFGGLYSGYNNATGSNNVNLGAFAGYFATNKSGNVNIGYYAGASSDRSNTLYIENSNSDTPLIYGDFANDTVRIHGSFQVTKGMTLFKDTDSGTDTTWFIGIPSASGGWRLDTAQLVPASWALDPALLPLPPFEMFYNDRVGGEIIWPRMVGGKLQRDYRKINPMTMAQQFQAQHEIGYRYMYLLHQRVRDLETENKILKSSLSDIIRRLEQLEAERDVPRLPAVRSVDDLLRGLPVEIKLNYNAQ